jgi:hypothetical protein
VKPLLLFPRPKFSRLELDSIWTDGIVFFKLSVVSVLVTVLKEFYNLSAQQKSGTDKHNVY